MLGWRKGYITITLTEDRQINGGFPHWHAPRNLSFIFMKNLTKLETLKICHPCFEISKKISKDKITNVNKEVLNLQYCSQKYT